MSSSAEVCIDAGLAIKVAVVEPDSERADALFNQWASVKTRLIAPAFFEVETDSILRKKVVLTKELTEDEASVALSRLHGLRVMPLNLPGQRERAWEIAVEHHLPTVYDATYLALAELRGCDFWTADGRLFDQVGKHLPFVRWLGSFPAP